jgi:hypothetical protein
VQAGCELRELPAEGGRRHHFFRAVLRDLIGNVWHCDDRHANQEEAHVCAKAELARRMDLGQIKRGGRQAT